MKAEWFRRAIVIASCGGLLAIDVPRVTAVQAPTVASAGEKERRFDAIRLVVQEADRSQEPARRLALLRELMEVTANYVADYPDHAEVWLLRAASALELDYPTIGWVAGQKLLRSELGRSSEPRVRNLMAQLERRAWLGRKPVKKAYLATLTTEQIVALGRAGDAEAVVDVVPKVLESWTRDEHHAWMMIAARQGHPTAYQLLGFYAIDPDLFKQGPARAPDREGSLRWYRLAAAHEDILAMLNIGRQLSTKAPANYAEAIHAYRAAVERESATAQVELAQLLAGGPDAQYRNGAEALRLSRQAIDTVRQHADERQEVAEWDLFLTLAAAHAENGNWAEAIEAQEHADRLTRAHLERSGIATSSGESQAVRQYKLHRPFRLPPPRP